MNVELVVLDIVLVVQAVSNWSRDVLAMVDEEEEVEPECAKDELELGLLAVQEVDVILFRLIAEVSVKP